MADRCHDAGPDRPAPPPVRDCPNADHRPGPPGPEQSPDARPQSQDSLRDAGSRRSCRVAPATPSSRPGALVRTTPWPGTRLPRANLRSCRHRHLRTVAEECRETYGSPANRMSVSSNARRHEHVGVEPDDEITHRGRLANRRDLLLGLFRHLLQSRSPSEGRASLRCQSASASNNERAMTAEQATIWRLRAWRSALF